MPGLSIWPVQKEQEILGIRVIGYPPPHKHLCRALTHLVLETVVVGCTNLKLDVELFKLPTHPVDSSVRSHAAGRVKMQDQRLPRISVASVGIARFGQKLFGLFEWSAHGPAAVDFVNRTVGPLRRGLIPRYVWWNRAVSNLALVVQEDLDVLLPVEGNTDGLAQLAVLLGLLWRVAPAHHGIKPVETQVIDLRFGRSEQLQPPVTIKFSFFWRVARSHLHCYAVTRVVRLGNVVVTLQELAHQRDAFFLDRKNNSVDKRCLLATVNQQT